MTVVDVPLFDLDDVVPEWEPVYTDPFSPELCRDCGVTVSSLARGGGVGGRSFTVCDPCADLDFASIRDGFVVSRWARPRWPSSEMDARVQARAGRRATYLAGVRRD